MVLGSQAQRQFFSSIPIRKPCGASHRCRAGCVVAWHWLPRAVVGPERAHLRLSVLLRDTGCRAPWPGRKGARLRMPALLRDTGCRAHCRTERGSPSEGGTIARGEAPRTHATSPALELPILRRRVLGFSSWFRKGPYARVAEWQTRWLQVPVSLGTWRFNSSLAHNDVWSPDYIKSPLTRTSVLLSCGLSWTRMAFRGLPFPTYSPRFPTYSPRHSGRGERCEGRPLSTRPSLSPLRSVTGGPHHG